MYYYIMKTREKKNDESVESTATSARTGEPAAATTTIETHVVVQPFVQARLGTDWRVAACGAPLASETRPRERYVYAAGENE